MTIDRIDWHLDSITDEVSDGNLLQGAADDRTRGSSPSLTSTICITSNGANHTMWG